MLPKEKVSVIVPIYKVEKYLNRCLDSIVKQTYINLEIILVDDGSPDNCGTIAESYAKLDSRIIVIHKKNGGLSDARNVGMQYATGDFSIFVDSDDWLENNMVETMVNISLKYKADVIQSAFYYAYKDYLLFDNRYYQKDSHPVVLDNQSLMYELLINERVKNFAWGKLYKTEIIRDIPFKNGVLFEDVFWAHQVMQRVNTYVIVHYPFYYYFQRNDSIVSNYSLRSLDILEGLKERHDFIQLNYQDLINESYRSKLKTYLIHYNLLFINRKRFQTRIHMKKIHMYIGSHSTEFFNAVKGDKQLELQLKLFTLHPFFNIVYLFTRKILRLLKILPKPIELERINLH